MPFNGSGTFIPPSPPTYPAVDGTTILASQFNDALQDIYTGLSTTLTRDGQGLPSGNLPMNGYKHTGAADASAAGQYLVYGQSSAALAGLILSGTGGLTSTHATADFLIGISGLSDGSDIRRMILRSGSATSTARGAEILLSGNEYASTPGDLQLLAGDTGDIRMYGSVQLEDTAATLLSNATAAGDFTIGNATADAADNRRLILRSGGAVSNTRGAYLILVGNEAGANPGAAALAASADIDLTCGGGDSINLNGDVVVSGELTGSITGATVSGFTVGFRGFPKTSAAAWQDGRCREITADVSIASSDMVLEHLYGVYNNSAATKNITVSSGTLRLSGTTSTGDRTILPHGRASIWVRATGEAIIQGDVA